MTYQTKHITEDDIFTNVNLLSDPAYSYIPDNMQDDYIVSTLHSFRLNALNNEGDYRIDFENDRWDMAPFLKRGENTLNTVFIFNDLPDEVKRYLKFFLNFIRKKEQLKISTLYIRYATIKKIIKDVLIHHPGINFDDFTTRMIIDTIESSGMATSSIRNYYTSIFKFYKYLIQTCEIPLLIDLQELESKLEKAKKAEKKEDTRLPNIPEIVAKEIKNTATTVMRDENAKYRFRLVACAIIMLFRLGVRINDLLDFRTGDLKKDATEIKDYRISYITYFINKLSRHNAEAFSHTIFASKDCVEAFETMLRIRKSDSLSKIDDHLFIYHGKPVNKSTFSSGLYPLYMYIYHKDICATDKFSEVFTPNSSCSLAPAKGKTLYFPDTRQYRVYLCTELYAKGVSGVFIEEHLKHLSSAMASYYNRPEDKLPEYISYAENVLETMVIEKISPIGLAGTQIRENIDKFLKDNHFNVSKDFDTIMDVIGDKVSIRAKVGGFCLKTSLVPCAQEAGTNKMLCAYNLCPNVYSFYYMLDYTYSEFKAHIEAYEQNYFKGFKNSAHKELFEIKSLISRTLNPQIKQLEEVIAKFGVKTIAEKHPNIIDIAANLTTIKKQITEWKNKTEKLPA